MKLTWDPDSDALYVRFLDDDEAVSRTEQLDTGTLVDLDRFGRVLGIEVLRPARSWPKRLGSALPVREAGCHGRLT